MTVSSGANGASTAFPSCHENLRAAVQLAGTKAGLNGRTVDIRLAIDETVTLLTPPSSSLLKHLLKVEGGAAE